MGKLAKLSLLLIAIGAATAKNDKGTGRDGKSLVNTFPFNQRGAVASVRSRNDGRHHGDHHAHHADHNNDERGARQRNRLGNRPGRQGFGDGEELNIGAIAAAGERCIEKVVMQEKTEYDDHIECKHSYSQRCHTTYTTDFEPQQQEECDETFRKNCFIEYKKVASEEKVRKCHTPLEVAPGPEDCKQVTQSVCTTRFHEHDVEDDVVECNDVQDEKCEPVTKGYTTEQKCTKWPRRECTTSRERVTKYTPETECKPVTLKLCGPGITTEIGQEECFDESATVVQEVPEETCNLEPQQECKHVTKLVPFLKPAEECVDIPKEVCSRSRRNPRKVKVPQVVKWCYVPTAESGLAE